MSKALYRKYRSKKLSEIVGQDHVTGILTRSLKKGIISHAYLLTGPRGVGKTSIARILAHEINQLPYDEESAHLDIIEIDAASNNGVEDVRDLREKVQIAPTSAQRKIYIIDEVHMLSKAAFNALLKTLEEPPEHVVFILATTDADKLPATILSRTQQFNFRSITRPDAVRHLAAIAKQEKISIDDAALELIAEHGDGSFRDSISLLDQLQSLSDKDAPITPHLVEQILGLAPAQLVDELLAAYETKNLEAIISLLDDGEQRGLSAAILAGQLVSTIRSQIAAKPQLISLLDNLLDVAKSSKPSVKLLTVLASHAAPTPKAAALQAPTKTLSAPLAELERQATEEHPMLEGGRGKMEDGQAAAVEDKNKRAPAASSDRVVEPAEATPAVESDETIEKDGDAINEESLSKEKSKKKPVPVDFSWDKLILETKSNYVAIYSVLSKCSHECDGGKLTIYTKNAFYKKKLDDPKHRINLSKAIATVGGGSLELETIPTTIPPKDSQAAAVAAIMGGGEEVEL